ncbi:IS630 orf [Reticulibacter mediterranei]|uniref:IS630 orf n=1 Tax=Reticulibacter mediterranei TaxID=2778369 RepID=A0A8J3N512_9CHLR|nr:IS630 family transposase [Reticulibacter mediterranei]GHO98797.1 IS630 orf [Reticulibacter mediterranei]
MSRPSEVYVRLLSTEEKQWVHRLYQQTSHAGLKSRCHIILLSTQHYSVPQIATLLFTSEDTVARCIHDFHRSGLQGILPQERVGRPPKITEEFLKKLLELVECDPRDLHYPFSTWTAELLALALKEQMDLEVSERSVRRSLHRHGYSVQRPVLSVSSPDPDYEQKYTRLQQLQQRALAGEIDLYYEDEVDLALLPGVMRCWSKQGYQRKIETPRQNKKQYGAGLIHWVSGRLYWATSDHKNNALFRSVLSQVIEPDIRQSVRKKYVVVDTYRIHFAKPVQAFLAEHQDEIELVCLPTYSPKLNPVECFWKHLRRQVTHNHFFQSMEQLMDAVTSFFQDMAAAPDLVSSVAGLAA